MSYYPHPAQRAVQDAYKRTRGPVAFLDESYQAPDNVAAHRRTFYIFSAAIVELKDLDSLRRGLGETVGGNLLAHPRCANDRERAWPNSCHARLPCRGPEPCVIAHRVRVDADDTDAEGARKACHRALAVQLPVIQVRFRQLDLTACGTTKLLAHSDR
ncbi:hypothetical protein VIMS_04116 [Mycobacterium marinum]|nr:hypothetical protein VIMS_04116 [Mycobacterium marinum]